MLKGGLAVVGLEGPNVQRPMPGRFPTVSAPFMGVVCLVLSCFLLQVIDQRDAALRSLDALSAKCEVQK